MTKKHEHHEKKHLTAVEESEKMSDEAMAPAPGVSPLDNRHSSKNPHGSIFGREGVEAMVNMTERFAEHLSTEGLAEALWRSENPKSTEQFCDLAPGYRAELLKRATAKHA